MCGAAALVKERRADRIRAVAIVVRCSMVVVAKGRGGTMFAPLRQRTVVLVGTYLGISNGSSANSNFAIL